MQRVVAGVRSQWILGWALGLLLLGCSPHTTQVHRTALPELVRSFQEKGTATVEYEGRPAEIRVADEPVLEVERKDRAQGSSAPLSEVRMQGGALLFPVSEGGAVQERVRLRDVERVRLDLGRYHPPDEQLMWGVGIGGGGPGLLLSPFLDFRPVRAVSLELGGLGGPSTGWGFVGLRIAPFALGNVRPFIGGFFQAIVGWDSDHDASADPSMTEDESETISASGARLGAELELQQGHAVLRAEFDIVHPLSDRWAFDLDDSIIPFGGVSLSYFP